MLRFILLVVMVMATLTQTSLAQTLGTAQKAEIEALIRSYILDNPEIIPEAMEILREKQTQQAIVAAGPALYSEIGAVLVGPKDASVTIVEFYDYQCGFCRKGLNDIERLLRNDKDVNVLFRQWPIRDNGTATHSADSAIAALAAGRQDGNFLKFHRALYESPTRLTKDRILQIAQSTGYDVRQLQRDMDDEDITQSIKQNFALARRLGLNGTPGYIIGDTLIPGAVGYSALKQAVVAARDARDKG
ncbi:MAG: DsbA family protein [Pseudomonadota bacterium]